MSCPRNRCHFVAGATSLSSWDKTLEQQLLLFYSIALYNVTVPKDAELFSLLKNRFYKEAGPGVWNPNIDLCLKPDRVVVEVEVPGVEMKDLQVSVLDNTLKIQGIKPEPQVKEGLLRYLCVERSYGKFYREIPLSCVVEVPETQAELRNGVLTITLPRRKNRRGREFSVTVKKHGS